MPTIYQIILIALASTFVVLFLTKTELRYKMRDFCDTKRISLIAQALDCDFCFCFWINVVISLLCIIAFKDLSFLLTPIFATPLTRYLL